jgi:transposase-like protein
MTIADSVKPQSQGASVARAMAPSVCPACASTDLTTTAKTIDASTYWRCSQCGEVWNVARREAGRTAFRRW